MDKHIRALRKEELLLEHGGWFDEENAERVVSWLVAAEDRRPVVLVGAGFTLNARHQHTGKLATREQAPLWTDVVNRLASDLDVAADRYDAPTLFEMYQEALGDAKLRDALRATVDDTALEVGTAHEALSTYQCEAIVTTNCLDTLLDRASGSGWRRVVVDADLSSHGNQRDLIYLHGHREFSDSWVITRSQYEDFARKKPVMLARVRQLLAQHPWLVVGFGMTDPNFHAFTRLLGLEMRGHQPLSLTLMREPPSAAERAHWRRLGFEIASPTLSLEGQPPREFADFFAWIFPKLGTSYSPTSSAAKGYIQRGCTPQEKLRRFREVYSAPFLDREEVYRDWWAQLEQLLSKQEQADANQAVREANRAAWEDNRPSPKTGIKPTTPREVSLPPIPTLTDALFEGVDFAPRIRPLTSHKEIQWLTRLVGKDCSLDAELAEHFVWGLRHHVFESREDDLPMEVLAIRMAKRGGWIDTSSGQFPNLIGTALASARKYGREDVKQGLLREVDALGVEVPPEENHPEQPHLEPANAGYRAYMNADFDAAALKYEEASRLASAAGLDFEEWVYTVGQRNAIASLLPHWPTNSSALGDEEQLRLRHQNLKDRLQQLRQSPVVARWIERANAQSRSVLSEVVARSQERERFRTTGSWGMRFGGSGHSLWRSFRDLETIHAPPSLQREYFEPLLPLLSTSDAKLVLLNSAKPRAWLTELLSRSPDKFADRQRRNKQLIDSLLLDDANLEQTAQVARLECMRELGDVFRTEDIPKALTWLRELSLGDSNNWVRTAWGSQAIDSDYWLAFSAAAQWAEPSAACDVVVSLLDRLGTSGQRVLDAAKALDDLPWHAWKPLETDTAQRYLEILAMLVRPSGGATTRTAIVTDHALFTLHQMLEAGLNPETLDLAFWKSLLQDLKESKSGAPFDELKRTALHLEQRLAGSMNLPVRDWTARFEEWFGSEEIKHDQHRRELWAALTDVVDQAPELLARLQTEVRGVLEDNESIQHYVLNPHSSHQVWGLLTKGMKHLQDQRAKIGRSLVHLLDVAPSNMSYLAEVLVREWWEAQTWDELMQLLVAACSGGSPAAKGTDEGMRTRRQIGVLALFGHLRDSRLKETEPLVWCTLQGFALLASSDERRLVANYAAFSVAAIARGVDDPEEAKLYSAALRRIAFDARVPVRSAIAHEGPALTMYAKSEAVRRAAREGVEQIEKDDNAQVSTLLARARAALSRANSAQEQSEAQEQSR